MRNFFTKHFYEFVFLILFIILIPLYSQINFYQNDDWNRNSSVERFMNYDFSLLDVTATTFYSQGLMGFFWSQIFGTKKIPILTLFISIISGYLFFKILQNTTSFSKLSNFLISLLLLFNPLYAYSSIGFMTENYLMFYFLLSLYFFLKFTKNTDEKSIQLKYLVIANFFAILAFYSKQNAVIIQLGMLIYLLFKIDKHKLLTYKELWLQIIFILITLFSYFFIFPRTTEMREKDTQFLNIFNFDYNFSISYGIMIYLAFFSLPIIYVILFQMFKSRNYFKIFLIFIFSGAFYLTLNFNFKPGLISWEEFPYFENTFERTGFLPRTLSGTKYQFKYNYDLYNYIDLFSKIAVCIVVSIIVLNIRKLNLFLSATFVLGIGILFLVTEFYDRYILLLLPIFILFIVSYLKDSFLLKFSLVCFIFFLGYFSFFLTKDFILTHNYVWSRSEDLVSKGVMPENIYSSGAWRRFYKNQNSEFLFSYDSFSKNPSLKNDYDLVETKNIDFTGNLFIEPKIYLYQRKNN